MTTKNTDDAPWFTVKQFAEAAHCHTNTVLKLIHTDVLPYRVLNPNAKRKTYRIPRYALRVYLGIEGEEPARPKRPLKHF